MSTSSTSTSDRWSELSRSERIALGKALVTARLEDLGCTVRAPSSLIDGKLDVRTPTGRPTEVFVSTQRVGGYVFWTKRRIQPASTRFAAIVPPLALGRDVSEPPGGLEQPVVIGAAARTALQVDRGAREHAGGVLAGELELDVRIEDRLAGAAPSVSVLDAEQLVQVTALGHQTTSSSTRRPESAILACSLPVISTGSL